MGACGAGVGDIADVPASVVAPAGWGGCCERGFDSEAVAETVAEGQPGVRRDLAAEEPEGSGPRMRFGVAGRKVKGAE